MIGVPQTIGEHGSGCDSRFGFEFLAHYGEVGGWVVGDFGALLWRV